MTLTLKFTFWITCWGSLSRITLQSERNEEENQPHAFLGLCSLLSPSLPCHILQHPPSKVLGLPILLKPELSLTMEP